MSIQCPHCGAVAGYGREPSHRSDCPTLTAMAGSDISLSMANARLGAKIAARNVEISRLRQALEQFASPANWSDVPGCLQWMGKRHAIEYAEHILATAADPGP